MDALIDRLANRLGPRGGPARPALRNRPARNPDPLCAGARLPGRRSGARLDRLAGPGAPGRPGPAGAPSGRARAGRGTDRNAGKRFIRRTVRRRAPRAARCHTARCRVGPVRLAPPDLADRCGRRPGPPPRPLVHGETAIRDYWQVTAVPALNSGRRSGRHFGGISEGPNGPPLAMPRPGGRPGEAMVRPRADGGEKG